MKVVCISASRIPSQTANSIQVMKACQGMARLGHQVHLLVPGGEAHPWERLAAHYGLCAPFPIEWLPTGAGLRHYDFALAAVRRARALKADALYLWLLQAAPPGLLSKTPVLLELHGIPEGKIGPGLFRLFLKMPGKKRLLPITRALMDILQRTYRVDLAPEQVVIAPNGVDLERYQGLPEPPAARARLGFPERLTAGYTGHLYPGRGLDLLLELARRHPEIGFLWVGGRSQDVSAWRERLVRAGTANVTLTGFVPNRDLPLYQAAMDLLLMPYERVIQGSSGGNSADYCSPMKMFEYLACGRAILSSDLPVIREVLDESIAILLPPDEVPAWSQALSELAARPEARRALGERARSRAEAYSWQARAGRCLAGFSHEAAP